MLTTYYVQFLHLVRYEVVEIMQQPVQVLNCGGVTWYFVTLSLKSSFFSSLSKYPSQFELLHSNFISPYISWVLFISTFSIFKYQLSTPTGLAQLAFTFNIQLELYFESFFLCTMKALRFKFRASCKLPKFSITRLNLVSYFKFEPI